MSEAASMIKRGTRVEHPVYGLGTYQRRLPGPDRHWVRWDSTGVTTVISLRRIRVVDASPHNCTESVEAMRGGQA